MYKKIIIYLLLLAPFGLWGQEITGRVMSLDSAGNMEDLIGASVVYKPTRAAVLTTAGGMFKLSAVKFPGWLVTSYVGFQTDSVWVEKSSFQHIHLWEKPMNYMRFGYWLIRANKTTCLYFKGRY